MDRFVSRPNDKILGLLRRLCNTAFGASEATMLAVVDGTRTRVVVAMPDMGEMGPRAGASAEFVFTHDQLRTVLQLGVSESSLATAAFRELLDQLANASADKVEFMQVVGRRLEGELPGRHPAIR